jgi:hypothetical protein
LENISAGIPVSFAGEAGENVVALAEEQEQEDEDRRKREEEEEKENDEQYKLYMKQI